MRMKLLRPHEFPRCKICGNTFKRRSNESRNVWIVRKTCSRECAYELHRHTQRARFAEAKAKEPA